MPSETPKRRELTGPKIGDGYMIVDIILFDFSAKVLFFCVKKQNLFKNFHYSLSLQFLFDERRVGA